MASTTLQWAESIVYFGPLVEVHAVRINLGNTGAGPLGGAGGCIEGIEVGVAVRHPRPAKPVIRVPEPHVVWHRKNLLYEQILGLILDADHGVAHHLTLLLAITPRNRQCGVFVQEIARAVLVDLGSRAERRCVGVCRDRRRSGGSGLRTW